MAAMKIGVMLIDGDRLAFGGWKRHSQQPGDGGCDVEIGNPGDFSAGSHTIAAGNEDRVHVRIGGEVAMAAASLRSSGCYRTSGSSRKRVALLGRKQELAKLWILFRSGKAEGRELRPTDDAVDAFDGGQGSANSWNQSVLRNVHEGGAAFCKHVCFIAEAGLLQSDIVADLVFERVSKTRANV